MEEHLLVSLSAIIILGIISQWISWKIRLPAILILLVTGIVAGPVANFINPEELSDSSPFVSYQRREESCCYYDGQRKRT